MKKTLILGCLLLAGLGASAWAKDRDAVLGANGEIYLAQYGTYAQLFPKSDPADAEVQVLALDIIKPDGVVERLLVPGTRDTTVKGKPALVYEEDSRTVLLIWENKLDDVHSVLTLGAFNGSTWISPIELTSRKHFSPQGAPQIAVTRDAYKEKATDGSLKTRHRTIVHLLWEEEVEAEKYATFYIPVIFEEGVYLKASPVFNLNQLVPGGPAATTFEPAPSLVQSPAIQIGGGERSVIAAFTSTATRRVFTVEIDVLPEELGRLADKTRSVIIDLGARYYPANLRALADQTKAVLLAQETDLQPEVLQAIAEKAHALILAINSPGLTGLADATRSVIIDLGARLSGLRTSGDGAKTSEIPREAGTAPPHLLQFRIVSSRPAPRGGGGDLKIFTSADGKDLLIAWTEADRIRYRESNQDGWTEIRETKLSASITKERAYEILEQSIRNR
jgi:hypothetical protein